jgi:hypothetical protein
MILIKAVPLEGHEGVQPGPGPLLMITWNHPDSVKVLAVGARTWFKGSA